MSVWFNERSIDSAVITSENYSTSAVAFTATGDQVDDPLFDGVAFVYTDQATAYGGETSQTFTAYYGSNKNLLFYELNSYTNWGPTDWYREVYRYEPGDPENEIADSQVFYERSSPTSGYLSYTEHNDDGSYTEITEDFGDGYFNRTELGYDADGNWITDYQERSEGGVPEFDLTEYDAEGNFLGQTQTELLVTTTIVPSGGERVVESRTLMADFLDLPDLVGEGVTATIVETAGDETSLGTHKAVMTYNETLEPMYAGEGVSTVQQTITIFADLDSGVYYVRKVESESEWSSTDYGSVNGVSKTFDETGVKIAETYINGELQGDTVVSSYEEFYELNTDFGYMETVKIVDLWDGIETTTTWDENGDPVYATRLVLDLSGAQDFTSENFPQFSTAVFDTLYGDAVSAVETGGDSGSGGTMADMGSKSLLLLDSSEGLVGTIDMWPIWGVDGNVISGKYNYNFYGLDYEWLGFSSDNGSHYYESIVTEESRTYNESDVFDEVALGYDANGDGVLEAAAQIDYNGDGDTDDGEIAVAVQVESGAGGPSGEAATETMERVYRTSDWTLIEGYDQGEYTRAEYGYQWVLTGETTTLPDDAVFEEIQYEGVTAYRVELESSGGADAGMGGSDTSVYIYAEASADSTLLERQDIHEYSYGDDGTSQSISRYDGNGNFIGSEWRDSDGSFSKYSETIEERTFQKFADNGVDLITVTQEVKVQTNESGGPYQGFYASEYLYDPSTWEFFGGYEVMDGRKTVYGPNWQVLDEVRAIDTSNVEFVELGTDEVNDEVLEPFRSQVTQKIVYEEESFEFEFGGSSSQDVEYFDANQTLIYLAETSMWTDSEGRTSTNVTYYDADDNWIGNSNEDASGWSSTNYRFVTDVSEIDVDYDLNGDGDKTDTSIRMEVEEGTSSFDGEQSESWAYYYEEGDWSLVYGEQSSNGVLTKYGQYWEIIEQTYDLTGQTKVETDEGYYVEFSNGVYEDYGMAGGGQSENKRVVFFDNDDNVLRSKEVWRWAEGSYWSESFSLYDSSGQWIGGGWEDSDGNYSENSETVITNDSGVVTGRISQGVNKNSGWSDEYYYEYGSDWNLVSGWQISNSLKTTYGANWEIISTEYVVDTDSLVDVLDDAGNLIGYQVVDEGSDSMGGMWGSSSWTRTTNLDLDQNIIGSVETWRWEDNDGFWSEDTSRFDEDGNWIGSTYESSDGYYSSYSQTQETIDGETYNVSAGSSKDGTGYSYSYRYVYDDSWNLVEGWEINGSVKTIYDSSWNVTGREAVQDDSTEYQEVRNKLDQLTGYKTEDVQVTNTPDGATETSVNVTRYDLEKEITKFVEVDRYEESEGYWSETRAEYDADRNMTLVRNEDSDGWFEEFEWSYASKGTTTFVSTETGIRTQDGGVFEWTYAYDSDGDLKAGSETFQGITYEYGPGWTFVRKIAEVEDLEGLENVTVLEDSDGAVTGYEIVEAESYTDPLGTYSSSTESTSSFDENGAFLGSSESWTWTDSVYGGSSEGVSIFNGRDVQTYGHSVDATGQFYAQGDTATQSGAQTMWELSVGPSYLFAAYGEFDSSDDADPTAGFQFFDEELTVLTTSDGSLSESVSYVPSDFFSKLLRSAGWEISSSVSEAAVEKFNLPSDYVDFAEELTLIEALTAFDYEDFSSVANADVKTDSLVVRDSDGEYAIRFTGQINKATGNGSVNDANSRITEVEVFEKSGGSFDLNDASTLVASNDNLSLGLSSLELALQEAHYAANTSATEDGNFFVIEVS